mmetsp:Transcript_19028/g.54395  ORF Transcript_19028/g.54395 Transcript_19028/m.54395 type:complete len:201 (-) Transcript_19028:1563-2165(-)
MSRMAFSVAAFSMSIQPKSRFSAAHVCTACCSCWSLPEKEPGCCWSSARRCLAILTRSGSLHVTRARLPARLETMSCAALRMRLSSGSVAKSFATRSLVVMHAIVTLRSTTGCIISRIARSTATGATRRIAAPLGPDAICAEIVMYDARFGITVCSESPGCCCACGGSGDCNKSGPPGAMFEADWPAAKVRTALFSRFNA